MRASISIAVLLVLLVSVYTFFRAGSFIFGPEIVVFSPVEHQISSPMLTITGTVAHATYFSINDRRVWPDKDGFFEETLVLSTGYTIVKLYAHNRQRRERIIFLPLYIQSL